MLLNEHHPGPLCSCDYCKRVWIPSPFEVAGAEEPITMAAPEKGRCTVEPYDRDEGLYPVTEEGCIYVTAYFNAKEDADAYVAWRNASLRSGTTRCPTCEGTNPAHHPATSVGGEVFLCRDPWHQPTADEIEAKERASFRSGVTWADATTVPLGRWAELCEKGHGQTVAVEIRQAMSLVEVEARPSPGDVSDTERMRDGWFHAEQALNKACWLLHRIDGAAKQIPENVEGYLEPLSEVIVDVRAFLNPGNAAEGVKP
jgi:hypothetical protein